jgi:hypothetical protein
MNDKRLQALTNTMERVKEDNRRVAEKNLKKSDDLGEPVMSDIIKNRFLDVIMNQLSMANGD